MSIHARKMRPSALFATDEANGKRDDDHKYRQSPTFGQVATSYWNRMQSPHRRRRILTLIGIVLGIWFFTTHNPWPGQVESGAIQTGETLVGEGYNGPITYQNLGPSLEKVVDSTRGLYTINQNILVPVSSLKSAAAMLPLACKIAKQKKTFVHFAFVGKDETSIRDFLEINGFDPEQCPVSFHDARPDKSQSSSASRAERGVGSALSFLEKALHPQAYITNSMDEEDDFFASAVEEKANSLDRALISIPKGQIESMGWISRLNAASMRYWNRVSIDIVIHASPEASGSLVRLLKSIESADYTAMLMPRLIIELPPDVESSLESYLSTFDWPPGRTLGDPSLLTLRRRINTARMSAESASIRSLESFYPSNGARSHVLILSPQAQLSPLFYQYLMYNLLGHRYGLSQSYAKNVMGISISRPTVFLNGSDFVSHEEGRDEDEQGASILWQAPDSNAALYFGDRWKELHSFLSKRLQSTTKSGGKIISKTYPAWLEYCLELMRARGYTMMYPGSMQSDSFVTIHNELYRYPEESLSRGSDDANEKDGDAEFLHGADLVEIPAKPDHLEPTLLTPSLPLDDVLPFGGALKSIVDMDKLSFDASPASPSEMASLASEFASDFSKKFGRCKGKTPEGMKRKRRPSDASDLFCNEDGTVEEDEWEDDSTSYSTG